MGNTYDGTLGRITNLLLSSLLGFSLVYALTSTLEFEFNPLGIFALLIFIHILFEALFFNSVSMKITGIAFGLILVTFLLLLTSKNNLGLFKESFFSYYNWIAGYIGGYEAIIKRYEFLTVIFLGLGASLLTYFFSIKFFNYYIILFTGFALFSFQWILGYFSSYVSFYIYLLLVIVYYFKYIFLNKTINKADDFHSAYGSFSIFTFYSLLVACVILLVSIALPERERPVEWPWLDNKIVSFYNWYSLPTHEFFSLSATGFGEGESSLGGKVTLDKANTLWVESPRHLYLKGAAYDTYTGYSWDNSSSESLVLDHPDNGLSLDMLELDTGMRLLSGEQDYLEKYFFTDEIKISYVRLRTKSLFHPLKTKQFSSGIKDIRQISVTQTDSLYFRRYMSEGTSYSLIALSPKYSNIDFANTLRKSYRGLYNNILNGNDFMKVDTKSQLVQSVNTGFQSGESVLDFNQIIRLKMNADRIYDKYLKLPDKLPQRVTDLAHKLTAAQTNDYDKAKAIEEFLSGSFPYTLEPQPHERGRDFVNSFLFEVKEGYCTYYASAMAVLARAAGLPARYVEGYMLPSKPESGIEYKVTNENAHAWVEIYFEGFGWLPFEPTAAFTSDFYYVENTESNHSPGYMEENEIEDYYDNIDEYDFIVPSTDSPKPSDIVSSQRIVLIAVTGILVALLLVIATNILRTSIRVYKMKKTEPEQSIKLLFTYYLKILAFQNLGRKPGETPYQYADRIDDILIFQHRKFFEITEIFVKARYSRHKMGDGDKSMVAEFYNDLISETRDNLGRFNYFVYRYLAGRF